MKFTSALLVMVCLTATCLVPAHAQTQVFQLSIPISGNITMSARDLNGPPGSSGGFQLNFNSLIETIYVDPNAATIRQIGAITYTPTEPNFSFSENQINPTQFPNPPNYVFGSLTVYLAPAGTNLYFDTGPQPLIWTPSISAYTVENTDVFAQGIAMTGSYLLVTGGQTYTNSFNYSLSLNQSIFSAFGFTNFPSSIVLSQLGYNTPSNDRLLRSPGEVVNFTAPNGFHLELSPGAEQMFSNSSNFGEIFNLTFPGTVTATNIPR